MQKCLLCVVTPYTVLQSKRVLVRDPRVPPRNQEWNRPKMQIRLQARPEISHNLSATAVMRHSCSPLPLPSTCFRLWGKQCRSALTYVTIFLTVCREQSAGQTTHIQRKSLKHSWGACYNNAVLRKCGLHVTVHLNELSTHLSDIKPQPLLKSCYPLQWIITMLNVHVCWRWQATSRN